MARRGKKRQFLTAYKLKAIKRVERGEGVLPVACDLGIFRILAIVDDFTRECLALVADVVARLACGARARDRFPAWRSGHVRLRQWHRLHRCGCSALLPGDPDRVALHCTRQANPKPFHRELHV